MIVDRISGASGPCDEPCSGRGHSQGDHCAEPTSARGNRGAWCRDRSCDDRWVERKKVGMTDGTTVGMTDGTPVGMKVEMRAGMKVGRRDRHDLGGLGDRC